MSRGRLSVSGITTLPRMVCTAAALLLLTPLESPGEGGAPSLTAITAVFEYSEENVRIVEHSEYDYDVIQYVGAEADWNEERIGHPQLPVVGYNFILPPETRVDGLTFEILDADTLEGTYLPIPIQGLDPDGSLELPDQEIYGLDTLYPAEPAMLAADGHMQTFHLASAGVYPLRFIGHTGKLVLATRLRMTANLRPLTVEESAQVHRRYRPDSRPLSQHTERNWIIQNAYNGSDFGNFYPIDGVQSAVAETNPFGGFTPTEFPSLEGPPIEYVIITDSLDTGGNYIGDLVSVFQQLADWKTKKGTPTVVKTVDWIEDNYSGSDTAAKIREFVRDASSYWGTRYVGLGGDVQIVPTRFIGDPSTNGNYGIRPDPPADAYYSELDASWNYDGDAYYLERLTLEFASDELLDLWVGRMPARDSIEAQVIVDKIFDYVRAPQSTASPSASYYDNVLLVAGLTNSVDTTSTSVLGNGIVAAEIIADTLSASTF